MKIREKSVPGYERVLFGSDDAAGYQGIIAIHSTALGPAVGGTRYWSYKTEDDAMTDALRLARGMTYKNALAGLPFGGGKSIILRDGKAEDREQLFRAHGRMVNSLAGKYFTAEDVGTSPADMEYILKETEYVGGCRGAPAIHHRIRRAACSGRCRLLQNTSGEATTWRERPWPSKAADMWDIFWPENWRASEPSWWLPMWTRQR